MNATELLTLEQRSNGTRYEAEPLMLGLRNEYNGAMSITEPTE